MGRKKRAAEKQSAEKRASATQRGLHEVALPAFVSAVLLWMALPPLDWYWLGWLAPLGWLLIVAREKPVSNGGYWLLWLSGCAFWLAALQGIRLAFWPLYFGWIALSLYLAVYIPLFVGAARLLHWRWKVPLVLAAPIAWVGWECVRSYLLTGFSAVMLAHTQVEIPLVVQIADLQGSYTVSFLVMAVSVGVGYLLQATRQRFGKPAVERPLAGHWTDAVMAALLFAVCVGYGAWRLRQAETLAEAQPLLRVLLVQENTPTVFESDLSTLQQAWTRYLQTTKRLVQEQGVVDVIVWPESTFTGGSPWINFDSLPSPLPAAFGTSDEDYVRQWLSRWQSDFEYKIELLQAAARGEDLDLTAASALEPPRPERTHFLLGSDAMVIDDEGMQRFNAALWVDPAGQLSSRYDKMHLVMFGEYIPLGGALQWLGDMFGFSGIQAGSQAVAFETVPEKTVPEKMNALDEPAFETAGVRIATNICFESTLPRLVLWQLGSLEATGQPADVLVNLTNDSWFRGSTILDHHLACTRLLAVETRLPILVAANTGLSAHIDGSGRLIDVSERLTAAGILAEPQRDGRWSLVRRVGYPLAWLCGVVTVGVLLLPNRARRALA